MSQSPVKSRAFVISERMSSASGKDPLTSNGRRPTGFVSAPLTGPSTGK